MICALLRRNLTHLLSKNLSSPLKSPSTSSISVLYFSAWKKGKSTKNAAVYEFLLHKHEFSPLVASHVASVLTHLENPEKCDSTLSFLKELGFSKPQLERTFKSRPALLSASLENIIKPKIKIFQDMDFPSEDIAEIISREPGVLCSDANKRIKPRLILLKGLLGSYKEVAKALRNSGWLLVSHLEEHALPNVEFLKSCGVPMKQIAVLFKDLPRFFLYKPEVVRKCVDCVDELGVDRSSKMFIYAVVVVGSMSNGKWEPKLQNFRNILGFSEDDILRVLRQDPKVFKVSEDKMKKVKEVLLGTGKYEISCILKYPKSLMYSVEQRYKPRIEVIRILESRHLIKSWPSLREFCGMSNDKFFENFVSPFIEEVGDVYQAHISLNSRGDVTLVSAA